MTIRAFASAHLNGGNIISIISNDTIIYNGAVANVPNYLMSIAEVDTAIFRKRSDNMGSSITIFVTIK